MQDELFDVVDEDDNVIGTYPRSFVHENGLIHRSVMFFLYDNKKRIFVNQRTANKEFYPEYWSIVFGGHVHSGETYEQAVVREALEEADISSPLLLEPFKKRFDSNDRENVRVYAFKVDGMPKLDPSEIKQGVFMYLDDLEQKTIEEKFLPETKTLYEILKRNYSVLA